MDSSSLKINGIKELSDELGRRGARPGRGDPLRRTRSVYFAAVLAACLVVALSLAWRSAQASPAGISSNVSLAGVHWYSGDSGMLDGSIPAGERGWNVEVIFDVGWCDGNPSTDPGGVREVAATARDHGLVNILRVDYRQMQATPTNSGEFAGWATNFIKCTVELSDIAQLYIVGNEPNLEGNISASQYAAAFNYLYGRRGEMPSGTQLLAAFNSPFTPPGWMTEMSSALSGVDGFVIHTGGARGNCQDPRQPCSYGGWSFDGAFRYYRDVINSINSKWWSKPIYITEFNTFTGDAGSEPIRNYPANWINLAFEDVRNYNATRGSKPPVKALAWFVDRPQSWPDWSLRNIAAARTDMGEEFKNPANHGGTTPPTCPNSALTTPSDRWKMEIWSNRTFTGSTVEQRYDAVGAGGFNFNWGNGGPSNCAGADNFAVRFTRTANFNQSGTWVFTTTTDDGVRLWVDSTLVIDRWQDMSPTTLTGQVNLSAGSHTLRMDYYENGGGAVAALGWSFGGSTCPNGALSTPSDRWKMEIWNNRTFTGSTVEQRYDAVGAGGFNFNWGGGGPSNCAGVDNFAVRFTRTANFNQSGTWVFTTTTDDGVRLWVDSTLVIDRWQDMSPTTLTGQVNLSAGTHTLRMDYYENGGGAVAALGWSFGGSTCPNGALSTPSDRWKMEIWNNRTFTGSTVEQRYDAVGAGGFNFNWGNGGPSNCAGVDNFAVRFTRTANFSQSGTWVFTTTTDDGVRLWVDSTLVIDRWQDMSPTTLTGQVNLSAGTHTLRMDYYENGGGAVAALGWSFGGGGGGNGADVLEGQSSVPSSMAPGETRTVTVRVQNTGGTTWRAADAYRLGTGGSNGFAWSGFQCGGYANNPGDARAFVCRDVPPGSTHDFVFNITAPSGGSTSVAFQVRMVRDGVEWFGETYTWTISVGGGGGGNPYPNCPCRGDIDNYCLEGVNVAGCPMTAPRGYCDPNGDGDFSDADWVRGFNEFQTYCPGG